MKVDRSAPWVVALLAVGGLALAQDAKIVDPWKHAVSALFPSPKPVANSATRAVGVASFPIEADPHDARPAVVPVGPPLVDAPVDPWVAVSVGPVAPEDSIVDPWAGSPVRAEAKSHAAADWAFRIREIVDPWARGPVAVAQRDPLIVDPWAPRH